MNKSEAARTIAAVQMLWPNFKAPATKELMALGVELWQSVLEDVSWEAGTAALTSLSAEAREFAPQPGIIRHRAVELLARADGTLAPDVDVAWAEVQQATRRRGFAAGPPDHWTHPAIARAASALGWKELCHSENPEALRAHFMKFYRSASDDSERVMHTPPRVIESIQRIALGGADRPLPSIGVRMGE